MSADDNSFNPWLVGGSKQLTHLKDLQDLKHVPGGDLARLIHEDFNVLVFDGRVSRESKEYERILYLLHSSRRWRTIGLCDSGQRRATPEFLSLVVLALTKTKFVTLSKCPWDANFFACLNSGMHTLTQVHMISGSIRISHDAAAVFSTGLALSGSLEHLHIYEACVFEPGAGAKVAEGIRQNRSLKRLTISESNLSSMAVASVLGAVSDGSLQKLNSLDLRLQLESDCINVLTKLMSSDTSHLKNLIINANSSSTNTFRTVGARLGKGNRKLKFLDLSWARFDESFLTTMLPMIPALSILDLSWCEITDLTPIIGHLCHPSTTIKKLDLQSNQFGINQAKKFVESLADMKSLTHLDITNNPRYKADTLDPKRTKKMLEKVSRCWNLESFVLSKAWNRNWAKCLTKQCELNLELNVAINRAWRRELCYNQSSPPSRLLPLLISRAFRKTKPDLHADIIFPLLKERISDLIPVGND